MRTEEATAVEALNEGRCRWLGFGERQLRSRMKAREIHDESPAVAWFDRLPRKNIPDVGHGMFPDAVGRVARSRPSAGKKGDHHGPSSTPSASL